MKVGAQLSGWEAFYADRAERRDAATDPALRKHFEAELQQAKITMKAMGIEVPEDKAPKKPDTTDPKSDPKSKAPKQDNAPVGEGDAKSPPVNKSDKVPNNVKFVDSNGKPVAGGELSKGLNKNLEPYREFIQNAANITGVPANLLAAVIWDESKGNASAGTINGENGRADTGLMQMNADTFAGVKSRHPDLVQGNVGDPKTNIMAGALYLKEQYDKFGSWDLALRAYNSGPLAVNPSDHTASTTGQGTKNYVEKVNFYWNLLNQGNSMPDGFPGGNQYY